MAITQALPLPLGTLAPDFRLYDPRTCQWRTLDELASPQGTVIVFMCNHCPFVKHILSSLVQVAREYSLKGIAFIGINPNDPTQYPEDSPDQMALYAEKFDFPFPYLFDETQETARAYGAACTPEIYVFDPTRKLIYHGQFDSSRPSNAIPPSGEDLRRVLDALLSNLPIPSEQMPSIGCSIKWRVPSSSEH